MLWLIVMRVLQGVGGAMLFANSAAIVNVALPDIQRALRSGFSDLQWVVDAYALTLAVLLLTAGSLADMYGRRQLYLACLVVFTGASVLCGLAASTLMLQLSRALQGVGGAIMFAVSLALLADAFRGRDRGIAFGAWGAVTGLAVATGPLLGGVLTSGLSWRWVFFVNAPIGVAAVIISVMKVAESRAPQASRPDWAGFALFTVALSSLVYGLIESNQRSFTNGLVLGCFAAAPLLLVAFVIVERSSAHPMFDLRLFRLPAFSGGSVAAFGLSASLFSMILYLVLYLQDILGYSPLATGVRLMVLSGGILTASTLAGRLTSHVPVRLLIGPGLIIAGPGDAIWAAVGCLAILVMGIAEVHASAAFRPTPQVANSSHASELALASARARMHRRQQARKLAQGDHVLARELGIGRPDVPHDYDDGGLVDVNHVPGDVLASCLGLAPAESAAVSAAREQLGRFTSPEELSAYAALSPDRVEALRDWMLFG